MPKPLVSVIIPTWNAAKHLGDAVDSALAQTYRNLEIIVVDDGSTDDTPIRLARYGPSIKMMWQRNGGAGSARNAGLRQATGDYVALLDSDDVWVPDKIAVQLAIAERHPRSGLIACDGVKVSDERLIAGGLLPAWVRQRFGEEATTQITGHFYREFVRGNPIASPSQMLIPRHVVTRIGPMVTDRDEAEDWDYTLRIAREFPVTLHSDCLTRYRVHPTSRSGPEAGRDLVWDLWEVRLLRRYLKAATPSDRAFLKAVYRERLRTAVYDISHHDPRASTPGADRLLKEVTRLAPFDPSLIRALASVWMLRWGLGRAIPAIRYLRRMWRRR